MKRPEYIKKGSTIGIIAPSLGLFDEKHLNKYKKAKEFFISNGYKVVEAKSLYSENLLNDTVASIRAKDFMGMYLDDSIDILLSVCGGELLLELLEYIDFEKLKSAKPKYILGYSDNTNLTLLLTTFCGIETIYGINATAFSNHNLKYVDDTFKFINGEKIEFDSYDLYEDENEEFTKEVEYIGSCDMKGLMLGGCLEVLKNLCGTKYDNVSEFTKTNKDIIFYFDVCELKPMQVYQTLWQFKNANWFNNVKGFVFGRTFNNYDFFSYEEAIHRALDSITDNIIINADLGHIHPIMPYINGRICHIKVKDGKAKFVYEWYH